MRARIAPRVHREDDSDSLGIAALTWKQEDVEFSFHIRWATGCLYTSATILRSVRAGIVAVVVAINLVA